LGAVRTSGARSRGKLELDLHDKEKIKELGSFFACNRKGHPVCDVLSYGGTWGWDMEDMDTDGVLPTRNFHGGSFDRIEDVTFEKLKDAVFSGQYTCYACRVRCKPVCQGGKYAIDAAYGGPQYETAGGFGPNLQISDVEVIAEAFSNRAVIPDVTTTDELNWWIRQRYRDLGLLTSDHPTITLQRCRMERIKYPESDEHFRIDIPPRNGYNSIIRRGDIIACDTGIDYLGLGTDTQQVAFVLKEAESAVPEGLR